MLKYTLEPYTDITAIVKTFEPISEYHEEAIVYGIRNAFETRTSSDWPSLEQVQSALRITDPLLAEKIADIEYY